MGKLDVAHFLGIYTIRKGMQEEGVTNPSDEVKQFTRDFVDTLSKMPLDEEIKIMNHSFLDSKGNIIAELPFKK
ncbi:hypothetical protein [uncultured Dokdonia sp.]|uniref:hypothetical protein n=1 Tax=uncultured Dokdonia sp. TaxID=575653 RepID=UPI00262F3A3B|nr:hypothetical protein [uncultured Dokdonia sp.]